MFFDRKDEHQKMPQIGVIGSSRTLTGSRLVTKPIIAKSVISEAGNSRACRPPNIKKPNIENLREHCRLYLSAQKTPSVWIQVPQFPLTGSGKVQKFAIREKYLSGEYGKILR